MPGVTVVVPLYNKGSYVDRALLSILKQSYRDFEVIVVDDGSTDDGPARALRFADSRIRLVSRPNGGPGAARNTGLAMAEGKFAAFLDADDEWLPCFLQASVDFLCGIGRECAMVTAGYYVYPDSATWNSCRRNYGLAQGVYRLDPKASIGLAVRLLASMSPCWSLARTGKIRQ